MWDERYSDEEYAYGKEPNDFLVEAAHHIPKGRVLCLAEGEGRNAVYLARQGYQVVAVDSSSVGMRKADALAKEHDVEIETVIADLADFDIGTNAWDGIVSIFCHLPPAIRHTLHEKLVAGLRPGGVLVLEAYTPEQLKFKTGGPADAQLTMNLDSLRQELTGLDFEHALEIERDIHEGLYHNGRGAVVQLVARKA